MGEAILRGWLASDAAPASALGASNILVVNPGEQRRAYLESTYGVTCVADVADAPDALAALGVAAVDLIVLAVKPQVMMGVLESIARISVFQPSVDTKGVPLFVSIAAGLATDRLAGALPAGAPVVRVMPNMPLMVGAGASGICGGPNATAEQVQLVADLFGCLGRAVVVDEADMDAVCALSGSGPAYVAALIEAMRDAAASCGLDEALAEALALQTVLGTARLIDETGVSPREARESICSPGGTTLAALDAMGSAGFTEAIFAGVEAAVARSKELAQS